MVDSVVFIINIFNETALKYSLNKCGGVYVLGYEGELWFGIHAIMNMVIVAFIIALLISNAYVFHQRIGEDIYLRLPGLLL